MEISTSILLIFLFYSIYYYFKRKLSYFKDRGIPYAPGWPVFGNVTKLVFRQQHITEMIAEVYSYNSDAKYVGVFNFMSPVLVIRDPELIKTVTITNFDNFMDHVATVDEAIDPLFGGNIFSITGDRWKEVRNLFSPAFTCSKLKGMFDLMIVCAQNLVNFLSERTEEKNQMIDTKELFTKYTNDVIASCIFGIGMDSLKNPKNDFYVHAREGANFEGIFALKFFFGRAMPKISKFFKIKLVADHIGKFFTRVFSTIVATRDERGISRPDLLQLMMNARDKDNKYLKMDMTEITAHGFLFIFAALDSSSTLMCALAHELALNPDIQSKVQDEIDDVLKRSDGKPNYETIGNMPYLDAAFSEAMRCHTQSPMLDRVCTKAFELPPALPGAKPFVVEPGMKIWIPAAGIHKDPQYYENPEKFDPDRYYQKKITINDAYNLSFGIGPRSCIGHRFALLETKILFFFLLSQFNLKPNAKTCNPFIYSKKALMPVPKGGYWLKVEKRLSVIR